MPVIVKYIVVRNGEEKMTFATKKEADAYDKMLDIADNLYDFLDSSKVKLNENQLEDVSLLLAENKEMLVSVLRGLKPTKKIVKKPVKKIEKKEEPKPSAPKKAKAKKPE
jgi:dsDNA-binding SOS-regulon protein